MTEHLGKQESVELKFNRNQADEFLNKDLNNFVCIARDRLEFIGNKEFSTFPFLVCSKLYATTDCRINLSIKLISVFVNAIFLEFGF